MRRVVMESPYAGKTQAEVDRNVMYARECLLDCLRKNESPLAGHLLYTQMLDEAIDRKLGLAAHLAWIECADDLIVYTDFGISPGMQEAIVLAQEQKTQITLRMLPMKAMIRMRAAMMPPIIARNAKV